MRHIISTSLLCLLIIGGTWGQSQETVPEVVVPVQAQLDAYNKGDIEAFLEPYADSVKVYRFPDQLIYTGKEIMRASYGQMFEKMPDLHCTLQNRIVQGNTVIDHESVLTQKDKPPFGAVAIYEVKDGKIISVHFIQ